MSDCEWKKLNIFNHAHNLLTDIGSLTLKKETMEHCRRTFCFVKHNVEPYFCCCCFRWLFFEILVCSPTSYMLWSLYVWHSESAMLSQKHPETSPRPLQAAFSRQFQKSRGRQRGAGVPPVFPGVSRVSCLPRIGRRRRTKSSKRHRRDERVTVLLNVHKWNE